MGGLLAARALADYYDKVTILERDALPEADEPRKGVPQGRHTHGLLARGREVLEQLFPRFTEEMVARGAVCGDIVERVLWFNHGFYLCNAPSTAWLDALGYAKPRKEQIKINVRYMTRQYRRLPEYLHGKFGAIIAACSPGWRFGAILAQEGERWIVSLGGYMGDQVPADDTGFLEFARSLPTPELFDVIRQAEPLCPLMPYQFSTNLRRRYEQLDRFPEGFLVYGDALCSFDPVYGQGMTVACAESLALRDCLAAGTRGIARRFFKAASHLIDSPWQIAVGSDLQHPRVEGKRTAQVRFINWYIAKFFQAAHRDAVPEQSFWKWLIWFSSRRPCSTQG
jgi:hypothetical protein